MLLLSLLACAPAEQVPDDTDSAQDVPDDTGPTELLAPSLTGPDAVEVDELEPVAVRWVLTGEDGPLRITGEPPGARRDPVAGALLFTPDSLQGGHSWQVRATSPSGLVHTVSLTVRDTVSPPPPTVAWQEQGDGFTRLHLQQHTDRWLAGPQAGRDYEALVMAPPGEVAPRSLPVRVVLHGFGGASDLWQEGWAGEYRVVPSDPDDTYWWGYSDGPDGPAPPYTQRRVLHLLEWVLDNYPGADPERVYLDGASMGGAGVMALGLLHARHFAWVESRIGQAIARNHRPDRIAQLSWHYGTPEQARDDGSGQRSVWDRLDMTLALADSAEARGQCLHLHHGKDDPLIHFGAVVHPSPLTGRSLYAALQEQRVGHLAVWDEGGHGDPDPVLGDGWWQSGWNPIFDQTSGLRRDQAFPAFFASSADEDPGVGVGDGSVPWDENSGYAGQVSVPGDTGWDGAIAGALNRGLRWDSAAVVDTPSRLALPLRALDQDSAPPGPGYPPPGDALPGELPVTVGVVIRRSQAFRLAPGEAFAWTFGAQSGRGVADRDGAPVIEGLRLSGGWQTLTLTLPAPDKARQGSAR